MLTNTILDELDFFNKEGLQVKESRLARSFSIGLDIKPGFRISRHGIIYVRVFIDPKEYTIRVQPALKWKNNLTPLQLGQTRLDVSVEKAIHDNHLDVIFSPKQATINLDAKIVNGPIFVKSGIDWKDFVLNAYREFGKKAVKVALEFIDPDALDLSPV